MEASMFFRVVIILVILYLLFKEKVKEKEYIKLNWKK